MRLWKMKNKGMGKKDFDKLDNLPGCAAEFVRLVVNKMRYRRKVRAEVREELIGHFEDELRGCKDAAEREQKAKELVDKFGDARMLGRLMRRAKKRCRPWWKKAVVRTFKAIGMLLVCFILYTVWFINGNPVVKIDYVEQINSLNRPEVKNTENALTNYQKAIELYVEPNDTKFEKFRKENYTLDKLSDSEKAKLKDLVKLNEAAWRQVKNGSSKAYCYHTYRAGQEDEESGWVLAILLPHLSKLRGIERIGLAKIQFETQAEQIEQALEDCIALVRLGYHLQQQAWIVEYLVGYRCAEDGVEQLRNIISSQKISAEQLKQLQKQLSETYLREFPADTLDAARYMFLDTVQRIFTDGGPGGGHLVPKNARPVFAMVDGEDISDSQMLELMAGSMIHIRRNETVRTANRMYDEMKDIVSLSPHTRRIKEIDSDAVVESFSKYRYFLLHIFIPALDRVSDVYFQEKCLQEAIITVLSLKMCKRDTGQYPEKLDLLVEQDYLEALPMDPYSDKPLVYRRTDEGFTLYSVGLNFVDDGGVLGTDSKDRPWMWSRDGDAVFWPVRK